ncbi:TonB-dependent receptor [Porticoccaceae bacterium LTM1]|nr:TonB-dependent receptor [Porticoccaceae bacterium LTM1]
MFRKIQKTCRTVGLGMALLCAANYSLSSDLSEKITFNVAAQPLEKALVELSRQAAVQLVMRARIDEGSMAPALTGEYTLSEALDALLGESGFVYSIKEDGTLIVRKGQSFKMMRIQQGPQPEEIVVTGTRLEQSFEQLAAHILVLGQEEIQATGEATLERVLRQLPQNINSVTGVAAAFGSDFNSAQNVTSASSVNLRGLGDESTLVLVNGMRIGKAGLLGGVSDVSGIPLHAVERIEVLLDGASSIYGSDAVGGVVNIVLREDYEGANAAIRYGRPWQGGFEELLADIDGGLSWESGQLSANFEYYQTTELDGGEREGRLTTSRSANSPANLSNSTLGEPLFYRVGDTLVPNTGSPPAGGIPVFQASVPSGQDGTQLQLSDFTTFSTTLNESPQLGVSLISEISRYTLGGTLRQEVNNEGVEFFSHLYYSAQQTKANSGVSSFSGTVSSQNPYNPFGVAHGVTGLLPVVGVQGSDTDSRRLRFSAGFSGQFSNFGVGELWDWQVYTLVNRTSLDSGFYNNLDLAELRRRLAESDPDLAFNPYGDPVGSGNFPEVLDAIRLPDEEATSVNTEFDVEGYVRGYLGGAPGGDVQLVMGGGWRDEQLRSANKQIFRGISSPFDSPVVGAYDASVSRQVTSLFTEALVPIIGDDNSVPGIAQLDVSASARYDSYSTVGSEVTWQFGMVWSPNSQVRARAYRSTAFLAPTQSQALLEPRQEDGFIAVLRQDPLSITFEPALYTRGGNPDLQPEEADTLSVGLEWLPDMVPGLLLAATWHQTEYNRRIIPFPSTFITLGVDDVQFPDRIHYDPDFNNGEGRWEVDSRFINLATVDVSGVDFLLRYQLESDYGNFIAGLNIAYTDKFDVLTKPGDPVESLIGEKDTSVFEMIPRYRANLRLGWNYRGLSMDWDANFSSNLKSRNVIGGMLESETPRIIDVTLSYDFSEGSLWETPAWFKDVRVLVGVNNIGNQFSDLQFAGSSDDIPEELDGLNLNVADPRGRLFFMGVEKAF